MTEDVAHEQAPADAVLPTGTADLEGGNGEVPFDAYWRLRMDGAASRLMAVQQIITHNLSRGAAFVNQVKTWASESGPVIRTLWPDRIFNLEQRFTMSPIPGTLSNGGRLHAASTHGIYTDQTVVRSFLALQATNLANLRVSDRRSNW